MPEKPRDEPIKNVPVVPTRGREDVLSDFSRIVGPRRGRNQDRSEKPAAPSEGQFKPPRDREA